MVVSRALGLPSALAGILAITAACSRCGGDETDGPHDASTNMDARADRAASDGDALDVLSDASNSDWRGWRRLTEFDPNCVVDVPLDPATALPPVHWVACVSGAPGCQQIDTSNGWRDDSDTNFFSDARVNVPGDRVTIVRLVTAAVGEFDVYSFPDFVPLAAWRTGSGGCDVQAYVAATNIALFATDSNGKYATTSGALPGIMTAPSFAVLQPNNFNPTTDIMQVLGASDTTMAFELAPVAQIVRQAAGTASYARTQGAEPVQLPLVSSDDVFAWQEYGPTGWSREFRVDPTGATTVFREVPQRKVGALTTDGMTMWWVEAYGLSDPTNLSQPLTDVFSAPYTNDPAKLASTASKVTTLSNARFTTLASTFNGIFAYTTSTMTYLVRKSDGKVRQVQQGGGQYSTDPVYVSDSDWYAIQTTWGGKGPRVTSFTRTQLGSW